MKKHGLFSKIIFMFFMAFVLQNVSFGITEGEDEIFHVPTVKQGSVLSVKDCVALAIKNSPHIKRKKYELDIAKSNVGLAKSRYFPVIGGGVGFNYVRNSDSVYYDKKYRDLPEVGVFINQLVYDFGKTTSLIKMEKFFMIGAEYEFVDEVCRTLFEIKARYYALLRASKMLEIAQQDVDFSEEFLELSKQGADKLTAKMYLSDAQGKHTKALGDYKNAKFDLMNSMYLDKYVDYTIQETPTFKLNVNNRITPVVFPFKNENAPEIAYKNSPDLQVIINTKNAMDESLKYIKKSYLPDLTAGVGYTFNNTYDTTNNGLQVGVGLSSEVNLKELKHNIDSAHAELNIADNEITLFKKDLYYEVQRALNNVETRQRQISTAQEEIEQARKNFEFVKNGYKENKLNYTALQDAKKDYIKAQEDYISDLYNYNMALIQTEMAMHYHIVDIHHKTDHAIHNHADELIEHLNEVLDCDEKEVKKKKKK